MKEGEFLRQDWAVIGVVATEQTAQRSPARHAVALFFPVCAAFPSHFFVRAKNSGAR